MKSKKITATRHFNKAFARLPKNIRETTYDKLDLYLSNPKHPSLRIKRIKGAEGIWEMSVTMNYRLTFEVLANEIYLRKIGTHAILNHP